MHGEHTGSEPAAGVRGASASRQRHARGGAHGPHAVRYEQRARPAAPSAQRSAVREHARRHAADAARARARALPRRRAFHGAQRARGARGLRPAPHHAQPAHLHDRRRRDRAAARAHAPPARARPGDAPRDRAAAGGRARGAHGDRRHRPRGRLRAAAARQDPPRAAVRRALRVHDAPRPPARPAQRAHAQGIPLRAPRAHLRDGLGSPAARARARRPRRGRERGAARAAFHGGAADRRRQRPDRQPAEPGGEGVDQSRQDEGASAADPHSELRSVALLAPAGGERRRQPLAARRIARAVRRRMKTPVFLLTGFLGSGKTTLLNRALKEPALANTAVVVNELGEIGLDQAVIAQATDNVVLLDAGCLCCANTGALHETLADLDGRRARGEIPPFERVIIETSGAADPAPLLNVLLGHPLVTGAYAFEATVCAIDAQHFLASRKEYPELDKQVALAERFYVTKRDLADPKPVLDFLQDAEILATPAELFASYEGTRKYQVSFLGPIRSRAHFSGIRAHSFRPPPPVTWAGWSAWSRLAREEFGARLIRVKGLLQMEDTIAIVQGVQGVFHPPQRFKDWPDEDRANRLVCISRDIPEEDIALTLPALNTPAGTQALYSMQELRERQ